MKYSFYKELQDQFIAIRYLHGDGGFDQDRFDLALASIRAARRKISANSKGQEKEVLLYCIDTLFGIIDEDDREKLFDYADAIHNIPEIYMQKRNLYSFRAELKRFQKKYGKHYFPFMQNVKPHFTKKAPKNKWEYFSASSDDDFKRLHPVGYKVLCAIGIGALFLPQIVYIIYVLYINPAPNEWMVMLGYVGAFVVGIGLFNIVAAWIHQYLGHLVTAVCLIGGTALALFSLYFIYA